MNKSPAERVERHANAVGRWRNPLPPALRVAAELHFGAWILFAVLGALHQGTAAFVGGIFLGTLAWVQTHFRGATSPAIWWTNVIVFTVFGVIMCAFVVTL